MATIANPGMNDLASGKVLGRCGKSHANIVPYQVFKAADQEFIIACGNDKQFVTLSHAIGLPELPHDSRFASNAVRIQHRTEIVELLSQYFATKSAKHWVEVIHAVKIPVDLINN